MRLLIKIKTLLSHYLYFLRRALELPPAETFRIVRRRVNNRLATVKRKLKAQVRGSDLPDTEFLRSLMTQFSDSWKLYLRHMDVRGDPAFFPVSQEAEELAACFDKLCPGYRETVVAAADRICRHEFDLLGSGPVHLGETVDWHSDFIANHSFNPGEYYTDIKYALFPGGFDIKVPWELSRCQHFSWLGEAYRFTGNEKYAREFTSQVLDWIQTNKPQKGVNWVCTMDVAIRAVNWIWGYGFFRNSPSLDDAFRRKFFKSLLIHGRHIMNNLEWMGHLTSNHYLSDVVGLVYLGIFLPEIKEAAKWREFGLQELEKELFKQVYKDGMDFEASISYHRLVLELFVSPLLYARLNGHTFTAEFMERLEKMFEFLMYIIKPDGTVPLIGDNDNGRLHRLKAWKNPMSEWNDYRYLLAVGAVLFDRDDFGRAAGDEWEEALWYFGKKACDFKQSLDSETITDLELRSCVFEQSGMCVIRDKTWYMLINAGPNGQKGNAGHTHNDSLSFELFGKGTTWILDPGTHVYTSDYEARNRLRSVFRHNTVAVDGEEQNRMNYMVLFRMEDDSDARIVQFREDESSTYFCAEHQGYQRLPNPVTHRRTIFLDRVEDVWLIQDSFIGEGGHSFIFTLQFAPHINVKPLSGQVPGVVLTDGNGNEVTVLSCGAVIPEMVMDTGDVSYGYGTSCKAPLLRFRWENSPEFTAAVFPGGNDGATGERIERARRKMKEKIVDK